MCVGGWCERVSRHEFDTACAFVASGFYRRMFYNTGDYNNNRTASVIALLILYAPFRQLHSSADTRVFTIPFFRTKSSWSKNRDVYDIKTIPVCYIKKNFLKN